MIKNILYGLSVLLMVLIIAWGGAWLFQVISEQVTKMM
jgi:hypothetical protein